MWCQCWMHLRNERRITVSEIWTEVVHRNVRMSMVYIEKNKGIEAVSAIDRDVTGMCKED